MKEKLPNLIEELQIGNWVYANDVVVVVIGISLKHGRYGVTHLPHPYSSGNGLMFTDIDDIKPIPLTYEILENAGFQYLPHFTVTKSMYFDLGRNRYLSIGCVGSPNEILWLTYHDDMMEHSNVRVIEDLICLSNFDYDNKLYLHKLQNIVTTFNKKLTITTIPPIK